MTDDELDELLKELMNEHMEALGRRLIQENERLCRDPAAAVPPEVERRALS